MDILEKIDSLLKEVDIQESDGFVDKDTALFIVDSIIKSIPDDGPLLEMIRTSIERDWKQSNKSLIENFNKILYYYGVCEDKEDKTFRKTILEKKGKALVRKFVSISNLDEIKQILRKK